MKKIIKNFRNFDDYLNFFKILIAHSSIDYFINFNWVFKILQVDTHKILENSKWISTGVSTKYNSLWRGRKTKTE
jgi:hypothetical protein